MNVIKSFGLLHKLPSALVGFRKLATALKAINMAIVCTVLSVDAVYYEHKNGYFLVS
jgi:hypothetical protein